MQSRGKRSVPKRGSVGYRSIARPAIRNVNPTLPRFGTDCLPPKNKNPMN
jgi:hypothetical protein